MWVFDRPANRQRGLVARAAALVVALVSVAGLWGALATPARAAATPVKWCGTDAVAMDRPDEVATHTVRVVYAIPADGADRFSTVADAIATDLAVVGEWWLREDPSREPRFDFFPFPGCTIRFGALDIASVRLSAAAASYEGDGDPDGQADRIAAGVTAALPGAPAFKKYLVYYDAPLATEACGVSPLSPAQGGPALSALVFVQPVLPGDGTCGSVGGGNWLAGTAAHELTHNFGAVLTGAPHRCPGGGHVCDNPVDNMYAGSEERPFLLMERLLDPGRDDYYGHAGSWWDVQDSLWLNQVGIQQASLAVTVQGAGRVYTTPAGVDCRESCRLAYNAGAPITVHAQPDAGMRLRSWAGGCTGAAATCALTLAADSTVTARFSPPNAGPTASFALPDTQRIAPPLALTSTSSDPDGSITKHEWNLGDGTIVAGASVSHTYKRAGIYRVRLTVTDDEGATASLNRSITITVNKTPRARFTLPSTKHSIAAPLALTSDARDSDGSIVTHAWDFGDGKTALGATVSHRYAKPGEYRIRLTVTDNDGEAATFEQTVTIVDSGPSVSASSPSTVRRGARVRLRYQVIDDVRVSRVLVTVRRGTGVIASFKKRIGKRTASRFIRWRTPPKAALYWWCVQAWDSRGQASREDCEILVVR